MLSPEVLDARHYAPADLRGIAELIFKVWPKPEKPVPVREAQLRELGQSFDGPAHQFPRSVVIRDLGRIVAHAALIPRIIGTKHGDMMIAGLSRVCSDPALRGTGLGARVVRPIFDFVDDGTFAFSLFQTTPPVQPFYEKLNAWLIENPVINSLGDPNEHPFWDPVAMCYGDKFHWPPGEIDLRGPGY